MNQGAALTPWTGESPALTALLLLRVRKLPPSDSVLFLRLLPGHAKPPIAFLRGEVSGALFAVVVGAIPERITVELEDGLARHQSAEYPALHVELHRACRDIHECELAREN